jgi:hypothetical protein
MTKEEIYDQQIAPLMARIIKICKRHKIAHVGSFSLDLEEGLCCTTALLADEFEPPEEFLEIARILYPPKLAPVMVTTRDASGQVTRMETIMG